MGGKTTVLKVYRATKEFAQASEPTGTALTDGKSFMKVAMSDGYLRLETIQLAGKKRMEIKDFLRGFHAQGEIKVN